jgi:hypothetical protein
VIFTRREKVRLALVFERSNGTPKEKIEHYK